MKKTLLFVLVFGLGSATSSVIAQKDSSPQTEGRSVCVPYDPAGLSINERGSGVWDLERGDGAIFKVFANKEGAEAGLAVARDHLQLATSARATPVPIVRATSWSTGRSSDPA